MDFEGAALSQALHFLFGQRSSHKSVAASRSFVLVTGCPKLALLKKEKKLTAVFMVQI